VKTKQFFYRIPLPTILLSLTTVFITIILMSSSGFTEEAGKAESLKQVSKKKLKVTFIGHATALIEIGELRIITDPVFSDRISTVKRHALPGLKLDELPDLTAILVSHAHYDHFDLPTLAKMDKDIPIVLPPGLKRLARSLKERKFIELKYWNSCNLESAKITAVPAKHYGGRWMVDSLYRPANGYIIESGGFTIYFPGDTARRNDFEKIGKEFNIDLALLPIGAYRPAFIMKKAHIGPADAVEVFEILNAKMMIPIHWGTFKLSLEPLDEPVKVLKEIINKKGLNNRVIILNPGEAWSQSPTLRAE